MYTENIVRYCTPQEMANNTYDLIINLIEGISKKKNNEEIPLSENENVRNTVADTRKTLSLLKQYDFRFENLVLEGGGMKMIGHVGAIKVRIALIDCDAYCGNYT